MHSPIRVLLLDGYEIVRCGMSALISQTDGQVLVGDAGTLCQARELIPAVRPDVVVLETRLPDGSGIDLCRELARSAPGVRCLFFTADTDPRSMAEALAAGAAGYLFKAALGARVNEAVELVAAGRSLLEPALNGRLIPANAVPRDGRLASLTARERDVLALVAEGMTNLQIGHRLVLSENTVKNYVSGLFAKLGVQRRTQAAVYGADLLRHHGTLHEAGARFS